MNDARSGNKVRATGLERLTEAACDAVTDDMVARLAENATQVLDLVDRVNRSGVSQALPALAQLVANGDLERLVNIARVYGAAEDAITDDMVSRLSETTAGGLELLDRVKLLNLDRVIPVLGRLVEAGDLDRVAHYCRLVGAAEDALSDDIVGRLAQVAAEAVIVLDRLNRSGVGKLIDLLDKLNGSGILDGLAERLPRLMENMDRFDRLLACMDQAAEDVKSRTPSTGGIGPLLGLLRDPENQASLRFALAVCRRLPQTKAPERRANEPNTRGG